MNYYHPIHDIEFVLFLFFAIHLNATPLILMSLHPLLFLTPESMNSQRKSDRLRDDLGLQYLAQKTIRPKIRDKLDVCLEGQCLGSVWEVSGRGFHLCFSGGFYGGSCLFVFLFVCSLFFLADVFSLF